MDPDEMKGMRDEHNSQENEEYSFLNETVKNPPIDFQKIFMKIIAIAGCRSELEKQHKSEPCHYTLR